MTKITSVLYNCPIIALRIRFATSNWLDSSGNAQFDLNYEVSDSQVICKELHIVMEACGYICHWDLGRYRGDNSLILCMGAENLYDDSLWTVNFDVLTGQYLDE